MTIDRVVIDLTYEGIKTFAPSRLQPIRIAPGSN